MGRKETRGSCQRREPAGSARTRTYIEGRGQVVPAREVGANSVPNSNANRARSGNAPLASSPVQGPSSGRRSVRVGVPPRGPTAASYQDALVQSVVNVTNLVEINQQTNRSQWAVLNKLNMTALVMRERSEEHWRNVDARITRLDGRVEGLEGRVTNLERMGGAAPARAPRDQQQQQRKRCGWCHKMLSKDYIQRHKLFHCPNRGLH